MVLDLLHPIAADHASNLGDVRVDPWRPGEESLEVDLLVDLLLQRQETRHVNRKRSKLSFADRRIFS